MRGWKNHGYTGPACPWTQTENGRGTHKGDRELISARAMCAEDGRKAEEGDRRGHSGDRVVPPRRDLRDGPSMQVTDLRVSWEEPAMESSGEVCCRRLHSMQTGPERNPFNSSQSAGRKLAPVSSVEGPSVRWRWERLSEASRPSVLLTTDLKSQDGLTHGEKQSRQSPLVLPLGGIAISGASKRERDQVLSPP